MFARWYDYELGIDWQTHSDFQIFEKQIELYATTCAESVQNRSFRIPFIEHSQYGYEVVIPFRKGQQTQVFVTSSIVSHNILPIGLLEIIEEPCRPTRIPEISSARLLVLPTGSPSRAMLVLPPSEADPAFPSLFTNGQWTRARMTLNEVSRRS